LRGYRYHLTLNILAETASGEALQRLFPDLVGKVIPVLRDSQIKFKKLTTDTIHAIATISDEEIETFKTGCSCGMRVYLRER